jgi:hypothetical protein
MNDLTPSYEPETGQVIFDGRPAGPAGEAGLVPVTGVDLAFDRTDGHLVRVIADLDDTPAAELLTRLFGPRAAGVLRDVTGVPRARPCALSPDQELCGALSSLARLDAVRVTSPVPASSPWWAVEAAVLADKAGLAARALAEASRAVRALSCGRVTVPGAAARLAFTAAEIADDRDAARRLRDNLVIGQPEQSHVTGLDVAAEVAALSKDCAGQPGPQSALIPGLAPDGLFRPGLSPCSDLGIGQRGSGGRITVQATLMPGSDPAKAGRCRVRLVDPGVRRVLALAPFWPAGPHLQAELCPPFPLDDPGKTWVEVISAGSPPVRGAKGHHIQRALRWADAALRAERAPAGLAPRSSAADWAALAAAAWERCRLDWDAAHDPGQAASVPASRPARDAGEPGPACLAEVLGG